jgi:hypothetical protein
MTTTWGNPPTQSAEIEAAWYALEARRHKAQITAFEYESLRKLLQRGEVPEALRPAALAEPSAEAPKETEKAVPMPAGWGSGPSGIRTWTESARVDDPKARIVHAPLAEGVGTGKSFLFLFGYKMHSELDQKMMKRELDHLDDDILVLRNAGYTVVVDPQGSRQDFFDALYGKPEGADGLHPAGIYWSAHGLEDGSIQTCDGAVVKMDEVDTAKVAPSLRMVILAACYVGARARTWRKKLGGHPLVVGWGQPVTLERAVEFLQVRPDVHTDLDDLIARFFVQQSDIPADVEASVVEDASSRGWLGDAPERLRTVAHRLGALWRVETKNVRLQVPLEGGRRHIVSVFLVDAVEPFSTGEVLIGVEAEVGELSGVVDFATLFSGRGTPGFTRVALVRGTTDSPRIVVQGFLPAHRTSEQDLTSLVYEAAAYADVLERRIFGGDAR